MEVMNKTLIIDKMILFLFGLAILIITRQVPLLEFSFISNVSLVLIPLLFLFKENYLRIDILKLTMFWAICLFFISVIFFNNDIKLAFRFLLIIILILTAYFIKIPLKGVKILFFFVGLQCIFLILMELILMFNLIDIPPNAIRTVFRNSGWGDIYSFNNIFFRIQLKGNALIPFTLFLTFVSKDILKNMLVYRIIFLLGLIISANFAYLVALVFFISIFYSLGLTKYQFFKRTILFFALLISFSGPIINYTKEQFKLKDEASFPTRLDQIKVLIDDFEENPISLILGKGLGNTVNANTKYRDYRGDIYFELQPVYFLNQLGFLNFMFFILLNIGFAIYSIRLKITRLIYISYILYSITNPYILDSNQVIVILTLVSLDKYLRNENRLRYSFI